ncbi:MAG: xylulokinase [Planctomycetes bacterium]|nr:xylulokinase [Planctomycetota bacterium]
MTQAIRRLFLGFDVGTQGAKGIVIDGERGVVVARAARSYGLIAGLPPGAAEQHPDTWATALRELAAELFALPGVDAALLAAIGVSGQQHGCVVLDECGAVVRPAKLWCDTSTAAEARELATRLGRPLPTGYTASKLLWLARHEPDRFARVRRVLLPHDWVNFRLTGRATMEAGDASGTGLFDPVARQFDRAALAAVDPRLAAMVPPLVEAGAAAGTLTDEGASWLGLPRSAVGAQVAAGGGDNMMSAIGSGATRSGVAVLSLGTSATLFTRSERAIVDPGGAIAPFCDSTGAWLPLLCVMNATGVLEEVRAAFGGDLATLTDEAERVEPGCGGLTFLPFLNGERVPDLPHASGALLGLRPGSLQRGRLFRAALEGVAVNLAWGAARMRALGIALDSIRLVGGGARNRLWRQLLADALAAPVQPLAEAESAALGAALQALWSWRRARGENVGADAVAAPWIRFEGEPIVPRADGVAHFAQRLAPFQQACTRLFGAAPHTAATPSPE